MKPLIVTILAAATVGLSALDIRNYGMGRMSILLESDINRIDLYDFGENPAGLLQARAPFRKTSEPEYIPIPMWGEDELGDYSVTELLASGYGHTPARESSFTVWGIGQPLPNELLEFLPVRAVGYVEDRHIYPSRPSGGLLRTRSGGTANVFQGSWSHLEEKRRYDSVTVNTPQLYFARAGEAGAIDWGADLLAFYAMASQRRNSAQFLGAGVGGGIAVPGDMLSFGANANYYHPWYRTASGQYSQTYDGHAARANAAAVITALDTLRLGARAGYKWADVEKLDFYSPWAGLRALYAPTGVPLVAGAGVTWAVSHPTYPGYYDTKHDSLTLAAGAAFRIPVWLLGIEVHRTALGSTHGTGDRRENERLTFNLGSELSAGPAHVRAGAAFSLTGTETRDTTMCYTGGLGLDLDRIWLDLAYNHIRKPGRYTEHLVYLAAKVGDTGP
ncbi:MAG: hypothetical protein JSU73_12170 [candidate division WOR-3 bacterium]|nr:MAG: hypothetical protein JSU73_12170 [candidate division WOR-3 bacterium]